MLTQRNLFWLLVEYYEHIMTDMPSEDQEN